MFIKIKSENPDISFILQKNPSSGMTIRSIRKGTSYGWYDNNNYLIYFKDSDGENSYSKSQDDIIDYNNTLRYNSSLCVINLFTEYFRHLIIDNYPDKEKDSIKYMHSIELLNLYISDRRMINNFSKSFPKLNIDINHRSGNTYNLVFSHTGKFSDLLGMVNIFALFMVLSNEDEYLYVDDAITKKFVDLVKAIDTPYYVKYLFKVRFFGNRHNLFDKYVNILNNDRHQLIFGDTHKQRINFVVSQLDKDIDVIDYGCGEGRYLKPILKHISGENKYLGFDIDEQIVDKARKRIYHLNDTKRENLVFDKLLNLYDYVYKNEYIGKYNIVLSEVIEHINYDKSHQMINQILDLFKPNKLIITTPNSDFNKFYFLEDGEFRHDDHKFELTSIEFDEYMKKIGDINYEITKHNIGDVVEGVTPSQGIVLTRKK